MSGSHVPHPAGACPFCGVATPVPHESQEGCIAALHEEIGRMRGILANLTPAGGRQTRPVEEEPPSAMRLRLTKTDFR